MVGESLRHANLLLLLLGILTTYFCFAIRALRWMRFSRSFGAMRFWNAYPATLDGLSPARFFWGAPASRCARC